MPLPDSRLATCALGLLAADRLPPATGAHEPTEQAFLRGCVEALGEPLRRVEHVVGLLGSSFGADALPITDRRLLQLRERLELTAAEVLTTALAMATESDLIAGRALCYLQQPVGASRPIMGAVNAFSALAGEGRSAMDEVATGAALRSGLLDFVDPGLPLPERSLRVPDHVALALRGLCAHRAGTRVDDGADRRVPLPPSLQREAGRHARSLAGAHGTEGNALVIRSGSASEGCAAACAVARALGMRALFIEGEETGDLPPWLLIDELLPVFVRELAPAERHQLPPLPHYDGPVLAVCGPEGSVEHRGEATFSWTLHVPEEAERVELWRAAMPGSDQAALELARAHRHSSARIAELGRLASRRAAVDERQAGTRQDVVEVSYMGESGLDSLAIPMRARVSDEALVLPPSLARDLSLLEARCRLREGLTESLGASATTRYRPGVRALFVGPSGTGKTLAAGWLATRMGLPLYRVDLASVVSKYIGETEKNLAQLLARAEHAEVVLLFDEADSLFGKRTEVKQSTDRFANAQTNYLLQRIESYDGIVLLTSNSRSRFDTAFSRRLDAVIDFARPGPEERRELWRSHLGAGHGLSPRQINQLSATVDLAGGHVRNVVLSAAVLAREEARVLGWEDILAGLAVEYRKLGKQPPASLRAQAQARG